MYIGSDHAKRLLTGTELGIRNPVYSPDICQKRDLYTDLGKRNDMLITTTDGISMFHIVKLLEILVMLVCICLRRIDGKPLHVNSCNPDFDI